MKPTRTERRIIEALAAGCFLDAERTGAQTVRVRIFGRAPLIFTTLKTVRAMVAKGFITRDWTLPIAP